MAAIQRNTKAKTKLHICLKISLNVGLESRFGGYIFENRTAIYGCYYHMSFRCVNYQQRRASMKLGKKHWTVLML